MVVCEEGHILQGYVQEDNEAEGVATYVTRKRRMRKNKVAKVGRIANPDIFHGAKLRFLFFQCAQIILRKQIQALIEIWGLPAELETIARDMWAMYVSLTDLKPEPFLQEEDEEGAEDAQTGQQPDDENPLQRIYDDLSESDGEHEELPDATVTEMAGDNNGHPTGSRRTGRPRRGTRKPPPNPAAKLRLDYTLVICYLACVTLKVPILAKDLLDLAEAYELPYLNALSVIPTDMRKHLDLLQADMAFFRQHVPDGFEGPESRYKLSFTSAIQDFAKMLEAEFEITFPPPNLAPMLWRVVKDAALPPLFYIPCERLLTTSVDKISLFRAGPGQHTVFPDVAIASAVAVCAKLIWGIDGRQRKPPIAEDPSSALPPLADWLDLVEDLERRYPVTRVLLGARSNSVANLTEGEVEEFLEFFEKELSFDDQRERLLLGTLPQLPNTTPAVDRYFPLQSPPSETSPRTRTSDDQRQRKIADFYRRRDWAANLSKPDDSAEMLSPGQDYTIWDHRDKQGLSHPDHERLLYLIGSVSGVHPYVLLKAMNKLEHELVDNQDSTEGQAKITRGKREPLEGHASRLFGKVHMGT